MSEKWTKGPWRVRDERIVGADGQTIRMSGVALPCGYVPRNDESFGNMSIAAAAPEMYEALKSIEWIKEKDGEPAFCPICRHYVHGGHSNECKLGAALKKARGEE